MITFIIVTLMGGSFQPQPSMPDHLFADLIYNMGNQSGHEYTQQEDYNFWCGGIRCDEWGHGGYDGVPEDCTTESEEDGTCGFGLYQP